ncbi:MAG: hypothetical protein V4635_10820 [Bacteroidota bacterium]
MKKIDIIFLICCFFATGGLTCQTQKDSLSDGTDSISTPKKIEVAQDDPSDFIPQYRRAVMYNITTGFDISYTGFIVKETETYIVIEDRRTHEIWEIKKAEIREARVFSSRQSYSTLLGENYHAGNYLFATSAFLFQGESIRSNYHWFLLENLEYGITENWAICASSLAFYPMSVGVKCAFEIDETNYIGGHLFGMGNVLGTDNLFLGYGGLVKFTRGSSNHNFTLSAGTLGINSDILFTTPQRLPFYNLYFSNVGYCSRLNEHVALNLEGWYFPQAQLGLAGAGIKLVKNEESCWTFGCYSVLNLLNNNVSLNFKALPIPYLGMSQKF